MTRKVTLVEPADSLKVILAAQVPKNCDIDVYYKTTNSDNNQSFDDIDYEPFNPSGSKNTLDYTITNPDSNSIINSSNEYREYTFTKENISQSTVFSIKIVLKCGNIENTEIYNTAKVPKIRDFRCIATSV
ncbi:MAG: hypothetical protein ACOC3V_03435 [bacterium]